MSLITQEDFTRASVSSRIQDGILGRNLQFAGFILIIIVYKDMRKKLKAKVYGNRPKDKREKV